MGRIYVPKPFLVGVRGRSVPPGILPKRRRICSGSGGGVGGYEDWTDPAYIEVDLDGELVVAANQITFTAMDKQGNDTYVYKDFGANYFAADFEFQFELNVTAASAAAAMIGFCGISNTLDDARAWDNANNEAYAIMITPDAGLVDCAVQIYCFNDSKISGRVSADPLIGTNYYYTFKRVESVGPNGTLYCYIYTDAARTLLHGSCSIQPNNKLDLRWLFPIVKYNMGVGNPENMTGLLENFEIV